MVGNDFGKTKLGISRRRTIPGESWDPHFLGEQAESVLLIKTENLHLMIFWLSTTLIGSPFV